MVMDLGTLFLLIVILGIVTSAILCTVVIVTRMAYPIIIHHKNEKLYMDPASCAHKSFPSWNDEPTIDLSVIVPAYNEEERLPPMLDETLEFLEARQKSSSGYSYEIIIVDDGSADGTTEVGLKYSRLYGTEKVRVMTLVRNRGKGGAVRLGMICARGQQLLFADADGATKFEDVVKLEECLTQITDGDTNGAIICGSRAHLEKESIAERSYFRTLLMHGFHFLVWLFAVKRIRDTQCGFKLLTRDAAWKCFSSLHVERWAFDVELLYIAEQLNIKIVEVAVNWTEIEGSKIVPVWSWLQMGKDLLLIWLRYQLGAWKIKAKSS